MDSKIKQAQELILDIFANKTRNFALSGGTALERYYLHHRFSVDLDFFSPKYDLIEIDALIAEFKKAVNSKIKLESEFIVNGRTKVRFYTLPVKGSDRPLKIDFVEDVIFTKPAIKRFARVPVYSVENIYIQKLIAVAGTQPEIDELGRQFTQGRRQARDIFDIYVLSKKIRPLHILLKEVSGLIQKGLIHWYQTCSRQELKLAMLDLDIYDKKFDAKQMIIYLEKEIKEFIKQVLE
jgi:predicted nucleotidyltransferase component of viral defense system